MADATTPAADVSTFEKVYRAERADIHKRRQVRGQAADGDPPAEPPADLRGLALSGGGIRSATFCLGVLQQLDAAGGLSRFDYLSTVSGGGFVGGWWSAWLSRAEQEIPANGPPPPIFPPAERIEPDRRAAQTRAQAAGSADQPGQPDGSQSAGVDPVHHLRLFANYLTPRKGALSADTWRAITVVSRNLLLTVVMLLPILWAAILAAQLYYVVDEGLAYDFVCTEPAYGQAVNAGASLEPAPIESSEGNACAEFRALHPVAHRGDSPASLTSQEHYFDALRVRAVRYVMPLLILGAWFLVATIFWMWFSAPKMLWVVIAFAAVVGMLFLTVGQMATGFSGLLRREMQDHTWFMPVLILGVALIALRGVQLRWRKRASDRRAQRAGLSAPQAEVLTNRMTRLQATLLVTLAVVAVTLLLGGFGHEVMPYLLHDARDGAIAGYVRKAGGWIALLVTLGGAIFTAVRAAPAGGADNRYEKPGLVSQVAFAVTPFLVLVTLMVVLASASHATLRRLTVLVMDPIAPLHGAILFAAAIFGLFAVYEFWSDAKADQIPRKPILAISGVVGILALAVPWLGVSRAVVWLVVALGLALALVTWFGESIARARKWIPAAADDAGGAAWRGRLISAIAAGFLLVIGVSQAGLIGPTTPAALEGDRWLAALALGGAGFAASILVTFFLLSRAKNRRMTALQTVVVILLAALYVSQYVVLKNAQLLFPFAIVALIGIALAAVVGLGWMIDPNYLALHTFYRARLVRAYLGASNMNRQLTNAEITESVDGDDMSLSNLKSCAHGGPYHLINTTLNLVAGRDLATAQRSAANFTLSRRCCGSLRTGYRPTEALPGAPGYMAGKLSLGTALAISGAAASPNMGSKRTSSALAMLLALLNVRLGFWAPTPDKNRWDSSRPRLWPFYLLREFLSQTNDLSSYCYLTDGGHFDNTGLYALVQRGCRYIVLVDCGADPKACFADLGEAMRRCRIDFGAEISLKLDAFTRGASEPFSKTHFVVGKIVYSAEHTRLLEFTGFDAQNPMVGRIIWIKPSLLSDDPADVLQYKLENPDFPQQTTADQWFDEAQFESYRRLGMTCAAAILEDRRSAAVLGTATLTVPRDGGTSALRHIPEPTTGMR